MAKLIIKDNGVYGDEDEEAYHGDDGNVVDHAMIKSLRLNYDDGLDNHDINDNNIDLAMMKSLSARLSGSENARGPRYTSLQCLLLLPWVIMMMMLLMLMTTL